MQAQDDRRNQMLDLARRWQASGTKARAFAQEHGVTPWVLYYWRQRLARDDRPGRRRRRRARSVTLAPVHVVTDADSGIEITLVNGDRVRVSAGVPPDLVGQIVRVLRQPC
jgi:transposase-like protein